MTINDPGRVLVTGGGGFIAGHCILQLLAAGHDVRTTVRSLTKEESVRGVLADAAGKVPTRTLPNAIVRLAARFRPDLREFVPDLGYAKQTSNELARTLLDWVPRDPREAIGDAAESMITRGLVST